MGKRRKIQIALYSCIKHSNIDSYNVKGAFKYYNSGFFLWGEGSKPK